ncbi:MAG TPA: hypothetical protein VKR06_17790 [Ktedonosporobacter sp.]|nr:hypothetical protein [Ktedonosporobacter sp.]
MQKAFHSWREETHLTWHHLCWLVPRIRGIVRDRVEGWYWYLEDDSRPGHVKMMLFHFPSLTDRGYFRNQAGWAAVGLHQDDDPSIWMLFDVKVPPRSRTRGLQRLVKSLSH